MSALPSQRPMTVAEFEAIDDKRLELVDGRIQERGLADKQHALIQKRLLVTLEILVGQSYEILAEFDCLPESEGQLLRPDIAAVLRSRLQTVPVHGRLRGAPDLAIEVLSPSNTASYIRRKRDLCLANGTVQFWVVYGDARVIEASTADGITREYKPGSSIPLDAFGATGISVADIFADFSD